MCECDRLCGLLVSAAASQPSVMGSNLTQLKGNKYVLTNQYCKLTNAIRHR